MKLRTLTVCHRPSPAKTSTFWSLPPRRATWSAFEELVNRYEDKIFRLTKNVTGNHEDAEDAMQDAFPKAYSHLQDLHGESRFYTWLVRIAANESLMRLRKRRPNQFSLDVSWIPSSFRIFCSCFS